ncbi:MAG: chromosomal replication initiator DnaA [Yoonia sp.]|uniref:chromosomal replication initiator DnaA n=1 Tax=Yoonia sp. TaxID=2212373 RepID=UPI003EF3A95D
MADQLTFDWPTGVALGPDDYFVSEANAQAYAMVNAPDMWPENKLVLTGAHGAGKSHLAGIFASQNNAEVWQAMDIGGDLQTDATTVLIEDMDTLPRAAEETVFHLHNNLRAVGGRLLMTAQTPPARWPIALPDLASRMQATTVVTIAKPDDALLSALIMKHFADRQISPKPALVSYLATRIERSYAAAGDIVARLDAAALTQGRKINKALAADLLDNSD